MIAFWIITGVLVFLSVCVLLTAYICYRMIFFSKRPPKIVEEYPIPKGDIYEVYRKEMEEWIRSARTMPHQSVSIQSFDGLTLRGNYYEYSKDAPIEILFHGYRGWAERDLSGGVARCHALGHSALIVDHRGSGESDGHVITFGVHESKDCQAWVNFVLTEIHPNAKIILTGISMGAATVLICSAMEFPKNVVGVLADCGYTSARAIIQKVVADMKLPAKLLYPFIRLGAKLFGGFDLEAANPAEAMKHCRVPVIFFHGNTDDFVPCEMSRENYEMCVSQNKRLVIIEGAGHGICFPVNQEQYITALREFFDPITEKP